jgi:DNA-directed RNA polymerase specialized sigma subunit
MAENNKNDRDHLNDMMIEFAPLINYHMNSMRDSLPPHIDPEDLHAAGMHGLIDAFHKYDAKRGANFNTYASQRIKGKMLDHVTAGGPSAVDNYHYKQAKAFIGNQPKEQAVAPTESVQSPIKKPE